MSEKRNIRDHKRRLLAAKFEFLAFVFFFIYGLFVFFDLVPLAERLSFSLGRQALSHAFLKSFSGKIGLALDLALSAAFIAGVSPSLIQMMMAPSGEGSSETGQDLPASTSQPTAVAHRSDPLLTELGDIKKPLIVDDLREKELETRLNYHFLGKMEEIGSPDYRDLIETQLIIEKKIELALRSEDYTEDSIMANIHKIRGYLFYPKGAPLKYETLIKHLREMEKGNNIPYGRIKKAIDHFELFLDKKF